MILQRWILRTREVRHNAAAGVQGLPILERPLEVVVREYKSNRTLAQNRLLWFWLKWIADYVNETGAMLPAEGRVAVSDEDLHEWFKARLLGTRVVELDGQIIRTTKSTTRLSVSQMTEYLQKIEAYCAQELELLLPHPADYYPDAMGQ